MGEARILPLHPEFTGDKLLFFVLDLEAVVATHQARATPLGRQVVHLAEAALSAMTECDARGSAEAAARCKII